MCVWVESKGGKVGVCRLVLAGKFRGVDDIRNVFTVNSSEAVTPNNSAIVAWFTLMYSTSSVLGACSNQTSYDRVIVEVPDAQGHWVYQREVPVSLVGGASSDYLPQQNAAVIIGITPSRRRGKKFIAGIAEGNVTGGVLDSGFKTQLQAMAASWLAGLVDGSVTWASGVCRKDGSDFIGFTGTRVDSLVGSQRRRKPGVGA